MENTEDIINADKLLFAIDIVDYVIIRTRPNFAEKTENILARGDRLRKYTYNRFNKTIKRAVDMIDVNQDTSVFNDFETFMTEKRVNKESFVGYAKKYRESNLSDGFHAKAFLIYCVRVANMAGYFVSYGVGDAPDIAVQLIMEAFPDSIMYSANWSKITKGAESLELLGNGCYNGSMWSDSSSESADHISSEHEDSASDSIDMDINVSSPEEPSKKYFDNVPTILENVMGNKNNKNIPSTTITIRFEEVMSAQSSDSACSSAPSSLSKNSNNDESPDERDKSKNDLK